MKIVFTFLWCILRSMGNVLVEASRWILWLANNFDLPCYCLGLCFVVCWCWLLLKTTWCFFEFERFLNPPKPKHASDSLILLTFVRIPVTLGMTGRHKASKLMRHWRHRAKLHNLNPLRQGELLWTLARKTRQELRQRREKVVKRLEEIDRGDFGSFGRD